MSVVLGSSSLTMLRPSRGLRNQVILRFGSWCSWRKCFGRRFRKTRTRFQRDPHSVLGILGGSSFNVHLVQVHGVPSARREDVVQFAVLDPVNARRINRAVLHIEKDRVHGFRITDGWSGGLIF